jgi:hypothetical protein
VRAAALLLASALCCAACSPPADETKSNGATEEGTETASSESSVRPTVPEKGDAVARATARGALDPREAIVARRTTEEAPSDTAQVAGGDRLDAAPETVAEASGRIDVALAHVDAQLEDSELNRIAAQLSSLGRDIDALREKTIMVFGQRRARWEQADRKLEDAYRRLTTAIDAKKKNAARGATAELRETWTAMKAAYPKGALDVMPELWTCPMHPEIMDPGAGDCSICGMPLEPIYETQPKLSRQPIIQSEIVAPKLLSVGERADLRIRLTFMKDGSPVRLDDLEEAHTRKIHLLIIDLSETDYHHEHPDPTDTPGEYAFAFTPRRAGTYRVWADLKPSLTRIQHYAVADIAAENPWADPAGEEPENRAAVVDGYRFELAFEKPVIHALDTVHGKLRVIGPDGKPYERLQVVMGAFGHFVGFHGFSNVLHMHPVSPALIEEGALGGPELEFYFRSQEPGLVRLYTQVRIENRELFPRFVVKVEPRRRLWVEEE